MLMFKLITLATHIKGKYGTHQITWFNYQITWFNYLRSHVKVKKNSNQGYMVLKKPPLEYRAKEQLIKT